MGIQSDESWHFYNCTLVRQSVIIFAKNDEINFWPSHTVCIPNILNLTKNQLSRTIFHRENGILGKNRMFFTETSLSRTLQISITQRKKKVSEFRKKYMIQLEEYFNLLLTSSKHDKMTMIPLPSLKSCTLVRHAELGYTLGTLTIIQNTGQMNTGNMHFLIFSFCPWYLELI